MRIALALALLRRLSCLKKLSFLASLPQNFSALCLHRDLRFRVKPLQKVSIFSSCLPLYTLCIFLFLTCCLASCSSNLLTSQSIREKNSLFLDELRLELADLKSTLHSNETSLNILEEKVHGQQKLISHAKNGNLNAGAQNELTQRLVFLEKKVLQLSQMQEKVVSDLHRLQVITKESTTSLSQYRDKIEIIQRQVEEQHSRLDEVVKLKSTLNSISKAIGSQRNQESEGIVYKVKRDETLQKIAIKHHTTVETLKKLNRMQNDRIFAGQELLLPNE